MKTLHFDSGIQEYKLCGEGVLRFNPSDPNLYARFMEAAEKIQGIEKEMAQQASTMDTRDTGTAVVKLLQEADGKMKDTLSWGFGQGNDFHKLLGGVNLLAVGANGQRVVTNLFAALQPILLAGAERCAKEQTQAAVSKAKARRSSQ